MKIMALKKDFHAFLIIDSKLIDYISYNFKKKGSLNIIGRINSKFK